MKILHIIDSGGLYGAEAVLLNLVAEQIKQGLQPVIASIGEKGIDEKPLEAEGIKRGFKVEKFRMAPGPNLAGMLKVLRYAKKQGLDLLHSHGYKGDVAFGFMPRKLRKIPLVSTLHGWTSTNGLSKNSVYEWLQRKSLKFIDAVVLVHNGMLSNPKLKKVQGVKFHIVNNGIPLDPPSSRSFSHSTTQPFNDSDKKIVKFCQQGVTIGSIGRLSDEKGYVFLIKAVHILQQRGVDVRLVIIGEGPQRKFLEELIGALGLSERVILPGFLPEARRFMPCFGAYIISSLTEGLPITLLEAMQEKVPVIATAVGGIPEVLDNGAAGMLIKTGDPHDIADAIQCCMAVSENAKDIVQRAYNRVVMTFSRKAMAEGYLSVYKEARSH